MANGGRDPDGLPIHVALRSYLDEPHLNYPGRLSQNDAKFRETRAFLIDLMKFLEDFPRVGLWYSDAANTAQVSLEIFLKAFNHIDAIHRGDDGLEREWPLKLFTFVGTMEDWINKDLSPDSLEDGPAATTLRDLALEVLATVVSALQDDFSIIPGPNQQTWRVAKELLVECASCVLDVIQTSATAPFASFTVTLFETPRISEVTVAIEEDQNPTFILTRDEQIPSLLLDILFIIVSSTSDFPDHSFFDITHLQAQAINAISDYCLSSRHRSDRHRAALMERLVTTLAIARGDVFDRTVQTIFGRVIDWRLGETPAKEWDEFDRVLATSIRGLPCLEYSPTRVKHMSELLQEALADDNDSPLLSLCYSYLVGVLPHVPLDQLRLLEEAASSADEDSKELRSLIQERLEAHENGGPKSRKRKRDGDTDDRTRIESVIYEHIYPDQEPPHLGLELEHLDWIAELMGRIQGAYNRKASTSVPNLPITDASFLKKLPCMVYQNDETSCDGTKSSGEALPLIPIALTVAEYIVGSSSFEDSVDLWHAVFAMLTNFMHHTVVSTSDIDKLIPYLERGLTRPERSVRLQAGKTAAALVHAIQQRNSPVLPLSKKVITLLGGVIAQNKPMVRETTIVALGLIGRVPDIDVQGQVIYGLIAQLGQTTSLIQAVAYSQLLDLAKFHQKGPLALISPHLPTISPYVVVRICSAPTHLTETCRFLGRSIVDFLTISQTYVLPRLVVSTARDALEAVAKHLDKTVGAVLLPHAPKILAHTLMVDPTRKREDALKFLTSMLVESSNGTLGVDMLLNSYRIEIVTELLIQMADEHRATADMALVGLRRLERVSIKPSQADQTHGSIGKFLRPFALGILSKLNTTIVASRGKANTNLKIQVVRSLGILIQSIGNSIYTIAPQIMALLQSLVTAPDLSEATLETWRLFATTLRFRDFAPHAGSTSAVIVSGWLSFSPSARRTGQAIIDYIFLRNERDIGDYVKEMVSLGDVPELAQANNVLVSLRMNQSLPSQLRSLLDRSINENSNISAQSLLELKAFMISQRNFFQQMASGDVFDGLIGETVKALFHCACRDGDEFEGVRILALDCIGVLGAVDPDRFDIVPEQSTITIVYDFSLEFENVALALHLIRDLLAGAYRGASDISYQNKLAFALQELLRYCGFTAEVIQTPLDNLPSSLADRWRTLPKQVVETVAALLDGRLTLTEGVTEAIALPVYPKVGSYREWVQRWTQHLLDHIPGPEAKSLFHVFRPIVRHQDVSIARHILPHLVLHFIISGSDSQRDAIHSEIIAVLEDQVHPTQAGSADKRLLSAQTIFILMDHISKWIRVVRQEQMRKRKSRSGVNNPDYFMDQLVQVESLITSIDHDLMAKAAFQTKAYARALMNFEQLVIQKQRQSKSDDELQPYYERLHEIYAHLDEPDGMQGISSLVLSPSLEHQIREHESTGRWTSAQSCWEIKLQRSPDDIELHLGLLRCLRNLGHYDTLETHIRGVLSKHPDWSEPLVGFRVEGSWMVGDWNAVQEIVRHSKSTAPEINIARVLMALKSQNEQLISLMLGIGRKSLGAPILAAGRESYRRSYDTVVRLHLIHELEMIHDTAILIRELQNENRDSRALRDLAGLTSNLSMRLESTLPTFRSREPILSMHRTALSMMLPDYSAARREIGRTWLTSAKIARKAGHAQTAYSAVLQAQQMQDPFAFIQSCKLVKDEGESYRALQDLESAISRIPSLDSNYEDENTKLTAKALLLRARWRHETDRFGQKEIVQSFKDSFKTLKDWESPYFHLGRYYDSLRAQTNIRVQIAYYTHHTCRHFSAALSHGSKYIFQTMPRLLTLWLDMSEEPDLVALERSGGQPAEDLKEVHSSYLRISQVIDGALSSLPRYQWYTAFPQIVSRIEHPSKSTFHLLSKIVAAVITAYPGQALWLFTSVVQSRRPERRRRGTEIIGRIKAQSQSSSTPTHAASLVDRWFRLSTELLALCDYPLEGDSIQPISIQKFPRLTNLTPCPLILPLQSSMTVILPSSSSEKDHHQPFLSPLPTLAGFVEEVEIMRSLQKPRKVGVIGSDGMTYYWLCKPKDDLRKDARLMDFNAIINKLLKTNSESRRRRLHIRTYSVIPLNEECGLIEWVPNTIGFRWILDRLYTAKGVQAFSKDLIDEFNKARDEGEGAATRSFLTRTLPRFRPIFHEWFIANFAEPTAWLGARLAYARTAAVISMVGYILGLGDRHGENILFDAVTGDTVHVDFNCLFERGKTFAIPERVPFRLTNNIIGGMGVSGVEGVFRVACEVTMQLLRLNKDALMSVLEAFVHDPLVEWEDERRKEEGRKRGGRRRAEIENPAVQLRALAQKSLLPIQRKLSGLPSDLPQGNWTVKEITTSNQVEHLIKEATSAENLSMMYYGWAPWL